MGVIKFGFQYWKKYLPLSLLAKVFSFIAIVCDILIPLLSAGIIDYIISFDEGTAVDDGDWFAFLFRGSFGELGSWQLFGVVAGVFAGLVLVRILFLYLKNVTFQWCGLRMECDLRAATYEKLLSLDEETLSNYNIGELLTTMNRDTIILKEMYSRISMNIFDSICVLIFSVAMLASFNPYLLILPVCLAPFYAVALARYLKLSRRHFRAIREGYSEINLTVQENIDAVRIVRSFAGEETELKKFDRDNQKVFHLQTEEVKLTAKYESIFAGFQQAAYVGTVIITVLLVLSGSIHIGALTAATTYVTKIVSHITQLSRSFSRMQNQLVSGGRLKRFLTEEGRVPDCASSFLPAKEPHLRMENVSLTLGEKSVLKNIDLDIPYGKRIGVMGGTGSGKSALLKTLCRTFDVTSGKITLDGTDIRDYSLEALRSEFSYVFQDVFLFSNTVDANIAFAHPDCEEELVLGAAETAQAARFIEKLSEGYETIIGERGIGLSGGQKQRVSIARALVKGAPVLVLDDASSALDMATERRVLAALKATCPGHTLLISAHRVSSVMDCDEVIYLRDGEIVERGTPRELIALGGAFAAIWRLQTSDGQLDDSSYGKGEL